METFIATVVFFAVAMGAMAIGVILSNRSLKGSCGGTGGSCACSAAERRRCEAEGAEGKGED